jgi:hypothetical protein
MLMRVIDIDTAVVEHDGWVVQLTFEYSGPYDVSRGVMVTVRHDDGTVIRKYDDPTWVKLHQVELEVVK